MRSREVDPAQRKLWGVVKSHSISEITGEQDDARLEQVLEARRSRSQAFFSTSVEKWDRVRNELFGSRIDAWMLGATLEEEHVIGDLGSGTGAISQIIAPWVSKVIAVDASSAMIHAAKKRLKDVENVDLRKGELTRLPIEDDVLTIGLLALVLPYVNSPQEVLEEVYRVTRRGGRLILMDMVPHDRAEYRDLMGHLWQGFPETQVREWLDRASWKRVRYQVVPPDPEAKGTGLFVITAMKL
jgi:ArsR family transcriptional regulator